MHKGGILLNGLAYVAPKFKLNCMLKLKVPCGDSPRAFSGGEFPYLNLSFSFSKIGPMEFQL